MIARYCAGCGRAIERLGIVNGILEFHPKCKPDDPVPPPKHEYESTERELDDGA